MEASPQSGASAPLVLRFFDVELTLLTDSGAVSELCSSLYSRFLRQAPGGGVQHRVHCVAYALPENPWGEPVLVIDGEEQPLPQSPLWAGEICDRAVDAAFGKVGSHFLFHAGALSLPGRGVILVGGAHHGKTSLTLELVRRGFRFLGDDIAALGRLDRMVYPFPKSLRLWPDTLQRIGFSELADRVPFWAGKHLVDIEELYPQSIGTPVPLTDIIMLRGAEEELGVDGDGLERDLDVILDSYDEELVGAIRGLAGVHEVQALDTLSKPALRVQAEHRLQIADQIATLCRQRGLQLLYVGKPLKARPTFAGPARLEAIPTRLAVLGLLRGLRSRLDSAGPQGDRRGVGARLFLELATLVGTVRCHALHLGPLNQMADLICGLMDEPAP